MSDQLNNRRRLLAIKEILLSETEHGGYFTIKKIYSRLNEMGLAPASIKTIRTDLKVLIEAGLIEKETIEGSNQIRYVHISRLFETREVQLIVDAIMQDCSIAETTKTRLVRKLKKVSLNGVDAKRIKVS